MSDVLIVVNFKAYSEVEGANSLAIAQAMAEVAEETGIRMVACPPMVELSKVASRVDLPVFSQHVNARTPGSATGWVTPQMVRSAGATGTLLNHSEHGMRLSDLESAVTTCRGLGLTTIVCTASAQASGAAAFFDPDYVAVEPPELIGGDVSVTEARPEVVSDTVDAVRKVTDDVDILCGAGVKTGEDVAMALQLGARGVLLASGVVKSADPKAALMDLVRLI